MENANYRIVNWAIQEDISLDHIFRRIKEGGVREMEQKYSRDEAEKHFGAKPEEIVLWKDEEGKWWWLRITTGEIVRAKKEGRKAMPRRRA